MKMAADVAQIIETGFLMVFGNLIFVAIFILAFAAAIAAYARIRIDAAVAVFTPLIVGMATYNYLPEEFKALTLIVLGVLYGMAIIALLS
jgi:hypothetical protein